MDVIEEILELFTHKGGHAYIGEPITQLDHALQTGMAAIRYGSRPTVITAALLHDIGHFLHPYEENCADYHIDSQHELVGEAYLREYFKSEVAELVKHHVNAKRYLTATNEHYYQNLTESSRKSLALQGGPMQTEEIKHFQAHPLFEEILLLRAWDEGAKLQNKTLPEMKHFIYILKASLNK